MEMKISKVRNLDGNSNCRTVENKKEMKKMGNVFRYVRKELERMPLKDGVILRRKNEILSFHLRTSSTVYTVN